RVKDGLGATTWLAAGSYVLKTNLAIAGEDPAAPPLQGPFTFSPGPGAPLSLNGHAYRGTLSVKLGRLKKLLAINGLGLESYLQGVVPREMPQTWEPEALKAQAVAARSYALSHLTASTAGFDVYGDERGQVYGGLEAEQPTTNAAVRSTAGTVVTYNGKVADA